MAKKNKNKSKEVSFNSTLRKLMQTMILKRLEFSKDLINEETAFSLSNIFKEWYQEIKDEFVLDYINYVDFCEILDYVIDLIIIFKKYDSKEFNEKFKSIARKLADNLKEKEYQAEYLVSINRISSILDDICTKRINRMFPVAEPITSIMFLLSVYVTTYLCKLENKSFREFKKTGDNKLVIKFGKDAILTEEDINNITTCYLSNALNKSFFNALTKYMDALNVAYDNLMNQTLTEDYKNSPVTGDIYTLDNKYVSSPFFKDGKYSIPFEKLSKIPKDRLYLSPKGGIKFEILDKSNNIDSIDLIEKDDRFYFNIYFINSGGITVSNQNDYYLSNAYNISSKYKAKEEPFKEDILKISFLLPKVVFEKEVWSPFHVENATKFIGSSLISTPALSKSLTYTTLCCIYLSYYDPFLFKDRIRMYNLMKDKKGGYKKTESFRIAHLRKLPKGYKSSKEATLEAKKAGFTNIPEGYTFVSASNVNLQDKKQKKIVIK